MTRMMERTRDHCVEKTSRCIGDKKGNREEARRTGKEKVAKMTQVKVAEMTSVREGKRREKCREVRVGGEEENSEEQKGKRFEREQIRERMHTGKHQSKQE